MNVYERRYAFRGHAVGVAGRVADVRDPVELWMTPFSGPGSVEVEPDRRSAKAGAYGDIRVLGAAVLPVIGGVSESVVNGFKSRILSFDKAEAKSVGTRDGERPSTSVSSAVDNLVVSSDSSDEGVRPRLQVGRVRAQLGSGRGQTSDETSIAPILELDDVVVNGVRLEVVIHKELLEIQTKGRLEDYYRRLSERDKWRIVPRPSKRWLFWDVFPRKMMYSVVKEIRADGLEGAEIEGHMIWLPNRRDPRMTIALGEVIKGYGSTRLTAIRTRLKYDDAGGGYGDSEGPAPRSARLRPAGGGGSGEVVGGEVEENGDDHP